MNMSKFFVNKILWLSCLHFTTTSFRSWEQPQFSKICLQSCFLAHFCRLAYASFSFISSLTPCSFGWPQLALFAWKSFSMCIWYSLTPVPVCFQKVMKHIHEIGLIIRSSVQASNLGTCCQLRVIKEKDLAFFIQNLAFFIFVNFAAQKARISSARSPTRSCWVWNLLRSDQSLNCGHVIFGL